MSLAGEKDRAIHRAEESTVEVARLEEQSRTLQIHLEAVLTRASMAEEKVNGAVMLMEATEVVPKFKTSVEFADQVWEAVVDSFIKGFGVCKSQVAQAFPELKLDNIASLGAPGGSLEETRAPMEVVEVEPAPDKQSVPLAEVQEDAGAPSCHPRKEPAWQ